MLAETRQDPTAMLILGFCHKNGGCGPGSVRDEREADRWYAKAAQFGSLDAELQPGTGTA